MMATQARRTAPRTQTGIRTTATARKTAARPARRPPPRYRPNYWVVAAVTLLMVVLGGLFLVTVAILWSLAGPMVTAGMVAAYGAAMGLLCRSELRRL